MVMEEGRARAETVEKAREGAGELKELLAGVNWLVTQKVKKNGHLGARCGEGGMPEGGEKQKRRKRNSDTDARRPVVGGGPP
ncbi:hypothetical protein FQN54_000047 [Arachnomyces sp. PD_36]|nr:hypothetical protein FQN54_000047 [Arachnomyces sp. PD_36]